MSKAHGDTFVTDAVIGAAIEVHSYLGPGALESAYLACLVCEVGLRGLSVRREVPVPVRYKGVLIDCAYRIDLLVGDFVIVEAKAVSKLLAIHDAQLLSYLRLSGLQLGLLINFHERRLKDGIRRLQNGWK